MKIIKAAPLKTESVQVYKNAVQEDEIHAILKTATESKSSKCNVKRYALLPISTTYFHNDGILDYQMGTQDRINRLIMLGAFLLQEFFFYHKQMHSVKNILRL